MHLINRAAIIVRPKQPFIDWASNTDEEAGMSAEFLKDEFQIYLVPEDPRGESEIPPLEQVFEEIFIDQLNGWYMDDSTWPEPITLELFHEWFDVQGNSMVMDLGRTYIHRERID